MSNLPSWLEQAVFYEIYPQSFYDSNGDGIGDIPGIIQKLDYIQSLGVNALWINPCFESPFQDAGYDVSDYYRVAPRYGTNEDLRRLFVEAKLRGLRVLLDLVPGHTSINHPWFLESSRHEANPYSDWFIWTSSAWAWEVPGLKVVSGFAERDASYVTNFFYFQPALNYGFANPDPRFPWQQGVDAAGPQAVRKEMRKVMAYWLDMGASGFRVDMAGSLVKQDPGQRETARLWREMRDWLEQEYPEAVLVSEWSNPSIAIPGGFHMDFMLHFGSPGYSSLFRKAYGRGPGRDPYGWSFFDRQGHGNIREFMDEYLAHYRQIKGLGHIALISGNHDIAPRLSKGRDSNDLEMAFLFLLTMPGTPYIYYGDEIGMRTVEGLPSKEGGYQRTGSRTPMQWDDTANAGFSTTAAERLYLPIDPAPDRPTVKAQEQEPGSLLHRIRGLLAFRKAHSALCASSDFEVVYAEAGYYPLVYRRWSKEESLLVAVNPSGRQVEISLPEGLVLNQPEVLYGYPEALSRQGEKWQLSLPPVSGGVYRVI